MDSKIFFDYLNRFKVLDELLRQKNHDTTDRLWMRFNERCKEQGMEELEVSKRTFEGLLTIFRGKKLEAPIKSGRGGYYYTEPFSLAQKLFPDYNTQYLNLPQLYQAYLIMQQFSHFSVINEVWNSFFKLEEKFVREGFDNQKYIQFDIRPNVQGLEKVEPLLNHIIYEHRLRIQYQKFEHEEAETYEFDPYCLKEHRDIWYLVGFRESGGTPGIRNLALDRIVHFEKIGLQEQRAPINIENYFKDVIGIRFAGKNPKKIRIKTTKLLAHYFELRPIMPDCEPVEETEDHVIFEFHAVPNMELENEILWWGEGVEVLEPISLRQSMRERIKGLTASYF